MYCRQVNLIVKEKTLIFVFGIIAGMLIRDIISDIIYIIADIFAK